MRGCLQKAKTTKLRIPKGHHTWNIILSLGRAADGKHKQKWIRFRGTRKQAEEKLTELAGEVHNNTFVEPSKMTLSQWLDEWLQTVIRPNRALNTYKSYDVIVRKHLKPALGHVTLQKLSPLHVRRYGVDLVLAPRTIAAHYAVLTSALATAVESGLVRQNVATLVKKKVSTIRTNDDALHNVWTPDEARTFLTTVKNEAGAQYAALFGLGLDSGMRKAELLGLRWSEIVNSKLRVERQLLEMRVDESSGRRIPLFGPPKRGGVRTIDLSDETIALLREHKRQQSELKLKNRPQYADYGLVFAQEWDERRGGQTMLGGPLKNATLRRTLDRSCHAADVKRITVHGLRHTCATLLLSAGVPPNVVQRRLGHSKIEMTLNIYAHVLPNMQTDAANRLAAMLHG